MDGKGIVPRYYFNVFDGHSQRDDLGTELPGSEQARREVVRLAGQVISDNAQRIVLGAGWHLEVRDELGALVTRLDLVVEAQAKAA
ncbi:DUF6894 family protein [Methylobacterium frigidaeris]|uniref:DUF6894 domain-containing protein n=1 Tax=Methylobacterium frigidaeris TaxID=2038277 RepID=A0AA37HIL9_9HYPH|nr:hypothetical protein [Methylobacterium frigidaeris]GJD66807.1 hypothetical protein MPEAHAMD_7006 [Methylobacterium frigidaeris]